VKDCKKWHFLLIVVFMFLIDIGSAIGGEKTITGFYMPTGSISGFSVGGTFLEGDGSNNFPGDYSSGYYHLGYDIGTNYNDPVYAIADGYVYDNKSRDGWYSGNYCLVVKHKTASGNDFLAFYGHIIAQNIPAIGSFVDAGSEIGKVGDYYYNDYHLHFGIRPTISLPTTNWGRALISEYSSVRENGFVNPIEFIYKNLPESASEEELMALTDCLEMSNLCGPPYSTEDEYYSVPSTNPDDPLPYCPACSSSSGPNGGGYDPGDEGTTLGNPDANVKKVEIDDTGNNWHHSYTATPGQRLKVRVKVTNKGDEPIDYFEVFIHRSNDLDFDEDRDHSYGREEEEDDLDPGESDYKHRTITAPTTPGIYYIFAYINRVDGEYGGSDPDWGNNYSRDDDPEEYAVLTVKEPTPEITPKQKAAVMIIIQTMILDD
jgi:hypothetical protein